MIEEVVNQFRIVANEPSSLQMLLVGMPVALYMLYRDRRRLKMKNEYANFDKAYKKAFEEIDRYEKEFEKESKRVLDKY